jgi:hypothetical protein
MTMGISALRKKLNVLLSSRKKRKETWNDYLVLPEGIGFAAAR